MVVVGEEIGGAFLFVLDLREMGVVGAQLEPEYWVSESEIGSIERIEVAGNGTPEFRW